jgi:hypothetical protein
MVSVACQCCMMESEDILCELRDRLRRCVSEAGVADEFDEQHGVDVDVAAADQPASQQKDSFHS